MNNTVFGIFLKVGLLAYGNGFAILPKIRKEMVSRHHMLSDKSFDILVDVAKKCPGVFAVNIAMFLGNRVGGWRTAVAAAVAVVLPSLFVALALVALVVGFDDSAIVSKVLMGVRPAVVALLACSVFKMAKVADVSVRSIWIPVACVLVVYFFGISPLLVVLVAGIAGFLWGRVRDEA